MWKMKKRIFFKELGYPNFSEIKVQTSYKQNLITIYCFSKGFRTICIASYKLFTSRCGDPDQFTLKMAFTDKKKKLGGFDFFLRLFLWDLSFCFWVPSDRRRISPSLRRRHRCLHFASLEKFYSFLFVFLKALLKR